MRFQASLPLVVTALTGAADAAAQAPPLETVIVTAQRRAENLAEVPMSVVLAGRPVLLQRKDCHRQF